MCIRDSSEAAEATGASANGFTVQLGPNPETLDPALNSAIDGANTIMQGTYEPAYNFVGPGIVLSLIHI